MYTMCIDSCQESVHYLPQMDNQLYYIGNVAHIVIQA